MKLFKHFMIASFVTLSAFSAVLYTSCTKDACKDVTCNNGGTCSGGTCTCTTGYEGTDCSTASRTKFIKTWAATDVAVASGTALTPYSAVIATSATSSAVTDVTIGNFSAGYFTNGVKASVDGTTITIASQQPDSDGYAVAGTGTINSADGKITWSYSITQVSSGIAISYTGTWN